MGVRVPLVVLWSTAGGTANDHGSKENRENGQVVEMQI